MTGALFPAIEPFESGMLSVGQGNEIYWEASGNPNGKPALYLHGGPGGGLSGGYRRRFDPERFLIVGFEQRGCGRSRPLVTDDLNTLRHNTTQHLIADIGLLGRHLGADQWLLAGASWGTTLALAYAQAHPERVSEIVLMAVCLTNADYVQWITESVGRLFPQEWDAFRGAVRAEPGQRLVDVYYDLLRDPDPEVRARAAEAWDAWEEAHISMDGHRPSASRDPLRAQVFATLVTHYWSHSAFLPENALLDGMPELADIPGVLIHGKLDVSGPIGAAWELHKAWPGSRFVQVPDEGHGGPKMVALMSEAINAFA